MTESVPVNTCSSTTATQPNDFSGSISEPGALTLARAYVVNQCLGSVYSLCEAFKAGTLFPELYRPYP